MSAHFVLGLTELMSAFQSSPPSSASQRGKIQVSEIRLMNYSIQPEKIALLSRSILALLGTSPQNLGGNPVHRSPFSLILPRACHREHQQQPKADSYISLNLIPVINSTEKYSITIDYKGKSLANNEKQRISKTMCYLIPWPQESK